MYSVHVQSEINANDSSCVIEYENPINNIRKEYSLRLHSVYSKANDYGNVDIPLTYKVRDARYINYFEYELSNNKKLSKVSSEIKKKLSTQNFIRKQKKFVDQPVLAEFNGQATDDDETTRYFDIKLPRKTYLFSNNKYVLYALGYSSNQIGTLDDVLRTGFSRHHIEPSLSAAATDISKIYVVQNNKETDFFPTDTKVGNLKWETEDKFENVYSISKRNQRYKGSAQLIRRKRETQNIDFSDDIVLLPIEEENIIDIDDSSLVKKNKLLQNRKWEENAEKIVLNFDDTLELDLSELKLQVLHWRDQLVGVITKILDASETVKLTAPSAYLDKDEKLNFRHPLTYLLQDEASYVQIAASKVILEFYKKYEKAYQEKLTLLDPTNIYLKTIYDKQLRIADERITVLEDLYSVKVNEYKKLYEESFVKIDQEGNNDIPSSNDAQDGGMSGGMSPSLPIDHSTAGHENDESLPPTKKIKTGLSDSLREEVNAFRELHDESPLLSGEILAGQNSLKGESAAAQSEAITAAIKAEEAAAQIKMLEEEIIVIKDDLLLKKVRGDAKFNEIKIKIDHLKQNVTNAQSAALSIDTYDIFLVKALAAKTEKELIEKNVGILLQLSNTYVLKSTQCDEKIKQIQFILNGAKNNVLTAATGVLNVQQKANAALKNMNESLQNAFREVSEIDLMTVDINRSAGRSQTLKNTAISEYDKLREDAKKVTQYKQTQRRATVDEGGSEESPSQGEPATSSQEEGTEGGTTSPGGNPPIDASPQRNGSPSPLPEDLNEDDAGEVDTENNDDDDDDDDDDNDDDDERLERNFVEYKKCSIGIIHFPNNEFETTKPLRNINKETKPQELAQKIENDVNEILKKQLNMSLQINTGQVPSRLGQNVASYTISNRTKINDNSSSLEICYPTKRDGYFLRLNGASSPRNSIVLRADEDHVITSDNFSRIDPFKDIFVENLPLIVTAVNAGPSNSFFSGIGKTSSLGIIEKRGRVRDAVTVYMRPAQRERFLLYFYTPYLYEKFFEMPILLYFHFIIEPL